VDFWVEGLRFLLVCKFFVVRFCEPTLKKLCWNGVEILKNNIKNQLKTIPYL